MLKLFRFIPLFFALFSCSTNYNKQHLTLETSLKYDKNYHFKKKKENNINYLLLNQEAGLYYFLKNDLDNSIGSFNKSVIYYNKFKESNNLKIKKNLTSIFISDTLNVYEGSDFEEALVHYYLGLSYLQQNNLNKALVEFRAAENVLKFSQESRQKKIITAENNINKLLSQNNFSSKELNNILQQAKDIRANNQSKFINGNIIYVSGIIKEINKEYNDALVNYKQAYNTHPQNSILRKDLYRLSLLYDLDYAKYLAKIHPELNKTHFTNYPKQNTIYLIYEQGFIPKRDNLKIPLIGVDNLILSINLPVYNIQPQSNYVNISIPEIHNVSVNAEETADIYKLANNQLLENYARIIATQLTKLSIQLAGQKALQSNNITKNFSIVFGAAYLLDSSDLRSWYTLPNTVKIAKIDTEKDLNNILLTVNNNSYNLNISVNNNDIVLLYVFDTGEKLYTKVIYKGKK